MFNDKLFHINFLTSFPFEFMKMRSIIIKNSNFGMNESVSVQIEREKTILKWSGISLWF